MASHCLGFWVYGRILGLNYLKRGWGPNRIYGLEFGSIRFKVGFQAERMNAAESDMKRQLGCVRLMCRWHEGLNELQQGFAGMLRSKKFNKT